MTVPSASVHFLLAIGGFAFTGAASTNKSLYPFLSLLHFMQYTSLPRLMQSAQVFLFSISKTSVQSNKGYCTTEEIFLIFFLENYKNLIV